MKGFNIIDRIKHNKKIKRLQQQHNKFTKLPSTWARIVIVMLFSTVSGVLLWFVYTNPCGWEIFNETTIDAKSIISLTTLIITAPIVFAIWAFRDKNKLLELENARKDTNLKEFQQLQRWATGNIEGDKDNEDNEIALQISALHSLRGYLKGEYGESFRRGAYEIFRAALATQHQKIIERVKGKEFKNITDAIDKCPLTKQLNIIANEEWFNLLINHNFPTNNISLLGVDLHKTYLHHRIYGKTLDLTHAQLQGADLGQARLQGADLGQARLQGADLGQARLQGADLEETQLQGANLRRARLQGAVLEETQLQGAYLWDAQLQGAYLRDAQLQGANLTHAQLQGADLRDAQLQGANLRDAQLQGADLRDAQLQGANLWDAQLQGADLRGAQLQGANLRDAQLQGADLRDTQLQGAYISVWNFEQQIAQQIGKETTTEALEKQYKALDETQKLQLIQALKAVKSQNTDAAIQRIESASETLNLSKATTGAYSQEEADKWLNDYKEQNK